MIHKLKRKFITVATVSTVILMAVLVAVMNIVNYTSVVRDSDTVLDMLTQNEHHDMDTKPPEELTTEQTDSPNVPIGMSPEVPFESRYFSVLVDNDGNIIETDLSKIISVDSDSVAKYITPVLSSNKERGFCDGFRYQKQTDNQVTRLFFLDCGRKLDSFKVFMWTSIAVGFGGCIIAFFFLLFVSGKILRPIAESYEKQKRFITDAGHEIKTPLTVINANLDLLEWDGLQNEELSAIRKQTNRLAELTRDLVFLSKMEEAGYHLQKIDFPLSDMITETADSFRALALKQNLELKLEVQPEISFFGSPDDIRKLFSLLLENALKYSPAGGTISVALNSSKKAINFAITNQTEKAVKEQDLSLIFDRFYRTDASRNSETGGSGIGLSLAKAITEGHNGTIKATAPQENEFCIKISFPLKK